MCLFLNKQDVDNDIMTTAYIREMLHLDACKEEMREKHSLIVLEGSAKTGEGLPQLIRWIGDNHKT